jgi:tRNA (guanosine-2'-O-)-methyltransferase
MDMEPKDRRQFAKEQPAKTSKWPRTERRQQRTAHVLARRQPDLTVVLENVYDVFNVSAVLRTSDAVGVMELHAVYTEEEYPEESVSRMVSAGAAKWIDTHRHESIEACYAALRGRGFRILATALDVRSEQMYAQDLTQPVALVFGNEQRGVSDAGRTGANGTVYIPMYGMVESLNISVAAAVTLYEAMRQRQAAGMYDTPRLGEDVRAAMLEEWLRR